MSYITTNYELHYDKPQVTLRQTGAHITSKHQSVTPQKFSLVDVQREKKKLERLLMKPHGMKKLKLLLTTLR